MIKDIDEFLLARKTSSGGGGHGGEFDIIDITPVLTEDSDRVISNAKVFYDGNYKWYVFDSNDDNYAYLDELYDELGYIGWEFDKITPMIAVKVKIITGSNVNNSYKIIASNDGLNWEDISETTNVAPSSVGYWITFLFNKPQMYKYFAVGFGEYRNYAKVGSIKFYSVK